ncbi:DUF4158 domain-containing protein [Nonomuraea sp. NPDC004186]
MPVDFLSDSEAAKYGRYAGPPSRAEMEKIFFPRQRGHGPHQGHRGQHIRCGFALQLVTVRYLGCFLADPLEVPNEVLGVVAARLGIEDPSCVKRYTSSAWHRHPYPHRPPAPPPHPPRSPLSLPASLARSARPCM